MKAKDFRGVLFDNFKTVTIEKGVIIGEGTRIENNVKILGKSTIGKFCHITSGTVIDNSHVGFQTKIVSSNIENSIIGSNVLIGPYSHLRPDCKIGDGCKVGNFVEIKSSSLGSKTKVAHLTYVGNAVVGDNVNIGCGVVFVNYDGKNKFTTTVGNNVFIGSNSNLIAPLSIADNVFIAAGTTVDKDLTENEFCIGRVRQEVKKGYHNRYIESSTLEKTQAREPDKKFFGTDGIRGLYGKDFTDCMCKKCACALCKFVENPIIVIGRDTRDSGENLLNVFSSWATKCGGKVNYLGIAPTPCVAYMSDVLNADFGVVFTASHNPKEYNGVKIFGKNGRKLSLEDEQRLDTLMQQESDTNDCFAGVPILKKVSIKPYIDFVCNDKKIKLSGLKIVLDLANGASIYTAPKIFKFLGSETIVLGKNKTGGINENCGCMHIENLIKAVLQNRADIGFAFDGDADRVVAVDSNGNVVDGDEMLIGLFRYFKSKGIVKHDTLVATIQSNLALSKEVKNLGGEIVITPVGDKYVIDEIDCHDYSLGGEQSGHLILGDKLRTGDGVLVATTLSCIIAEEGIKIEKLCQLDLFFQKQKSFMCDNKEDIVKDEELLEEVSKCEKELDINGRVLLRASGTEPKVRLLVECENEKKCSKIFAHLETFLQNKIDS